MLGLGVDAAAASPRTRMAYGASSRVLARLDVRAADVTEGHVPWGTDPEGTARGEGCGRNAPEGTDPSGRRGRDAGRFRRTRGFFRDHDSIVETHDPGRR